MQQNRIAQLLTLAVATSLLLMTLGEIEMAAAAAVSDPPGPMSPARKAANDRYYEIARQLFASELLNEESPQMAQQPQVTMDEDYPAYELELNKHPYQKQQERGSRHRQAQKKWYEWGK